MERRVAEKTVSICVVPKVVQRMVVSLCRGALKGTIPILHSLSISFKAPLSVTSQASHLNWLVRPNGHELPDSSCHTSLRCHETNPSNTEREQSPLPSLWSLFSSLQCHVHRHTELANSWLKIALISSDPFGWLLTQSPSRHTSFQKRTSDPFLKQKISSMSRSTGKRKPAGSKEECMGVLFLCLV